MPSSDPGSSSNNRKFMWIALFVAALLIMYLVPLGAHPLLEPDEGRYSEIPREMVESGNYVTPMLNYIKYFEKPAVLYWMNAASFHVFGQNEFAARFPVAVCAILGAIVTALLGAFIFNRRSGLLAGMITGFSLLYFAVGTLNVTDMPVAFFMTLALAAFYAGHIRQNRRWYLLFYAAMAAALLTKGLIGIVLPAGIIFWYIIFTRKWKLFLEALYIPGIILFFVLSVPWFYAVCKANSDFFYFFFIREHFLRYFTKMHDRYEPFWFFLPLIPAGLIPWTGFLPALFSKQSVVRSPENGAAKDANIFLLTWFGLILLFFSLSDSKLVPYIVPCMPPLAILMGADIDRMLERKSWHGWPIGISLVFGVIFAIALYYFGLNNKYMMPSEGARIAATLSVGLLIGPVMAVFFTSNGNSRFRAAVIAFCVASLFFICGAQQIYTVMGKTRSSRAIADVIIKERQPGDTIAVYDEVLQDIPFYTKQRVMLVNYLGELEFGSKHAEGKGWFPSKAEFTREWKSGRPFILVAETENLHTLFPDESGGAVNKMYVGDYTILFNRKEAK